MAKLGFKNGVVSVILRVKIMDNTSTTGGAKTGLTFSSSGLIISTIADNEATPTTYTAAGSTIETITTLGTFAAPTATKCRFKEVDATNHPGLYEIQIADARWAVSNARSVIVSVSGATGAAQVDAEVQLVTDDPYTAKPANYASLVIDSTGRVNAFLIGILTTVFTEGAAGRIAAAFKQFFNIATPAATMDHGILVDTVTTYTGNTPQTGDNYARLGAPAGASVSADIAAVKTDTGNLVTRITSALFSGITSLAQWLGLIAGKQVGNSTARTEVRATGAGSGTFDETTDSQEALRDRGDAAWITATGFSTLDAAGVRSAVGLASANLDTQLGAIAAYIDTEVAAIKAKTDNLPASPAAVGSAMTLTSGERDSIASAYLGLTDGIETGLTPKQALRLIVAALAGQLSGAATTTITIKAAGVPGTTRVVATVDADGNRSALTLTP